MLNNRIFGTQKPDKHYIKRPGVYGVALNQQDEEPLKVAVVKVPFGYHLPGGGIEADEDHEACLEREFLEETGCEIEIHHPVCVSHQFAYSPRSKNYYELIGTFYAVTITGQIATPLETDHQLEWLPVHEAIRKLSLEYQKDAVKRAASNP